MMHSFLLVGQSNMAGRGNPADVEPISNEDIYVLRNGRWWPMYVPVNCDRRTAGINLAESFADAYRKDHPGVKIGLIPCADGGTKLDQWQPGEVLFDNAVFQAGLAMRSSQLCGILWHQGESDCADANWPDYEEKCTHVLESMRKALGENLPVMVGGLGDFLLQLSLEKPRFRNAPQVTRQLRQMAEKLPNYGFVDATGLTDKGDKLHFSAHALREFGLRYYEVFKTLDAPIPCEEPIKDATSASAIEAL